MAGRAVVWAGGHAAAEDEERCASEAEEDEICRDNVVQDLFVFAGDADDSRKDALQRDGNDGDAGAFGQPGDLLERRVRLWPWQRKRAGR